MKLILTENWKLLQKKYGILKPMAEMIADRIYGTQELDPVSVDINNSQTHQRLSRIRQYGGPTEWGFLKASPGLTMQMAQ